MRISDWSSDVCSSDLPGTTLIEQFTYRAEGHSTSDDPAQYRSAEERSAWPLGDPIIRLKQHLIGLGVWDEERHAEMDRELAEQVKAAAKEAEKNGVLGRSEEHTSELQSLMRISYAVFCLKQ